MAEHAEFVASIAEMKSRHLVSVYDIAVNPKSKTWHTETQNMRFNMDINIEINALAVYSL